MFITDIVIVHMFITDIANAAVVFYMIFTASIIVCLSHLTHLSICNKPAQLMDIY